MSFCSAGYFYCVFFFTVNYTQPLPYHIRESNFDYQIQF